MLAHTTPAWRKSSHSGEATDCVEAAGIGDTVALRDSKDPGGPQLRLLRHEWSALLSKIKLIG